MTDKPETPGSVAALHDDSAPATPSNASASDVNLPEYEAEAIRHLQRGLGKDSIIERLTKSGLSRVAATNLVEKVWREHSDERRANARILIGMAIVLLVISGGLLLPRVLSGDPLPTFSVLYLLMGLAAWFIIKGLRDLRGTGAS